MLLQISYSYHLFVRNKFTTLTLRDALSQSTLLTVSSKYKHPSRTQTNFMQNMTSFVCMLVKCDVENRWGTIYPIKDISIVPFTPANLLHSLSTRASICLSWDHNRNSI
jgi:hypothetical protein